MTKIEELIFEKLIQDGNAENIYKAGCNWEQFDYKKGFEALIKKDKVGEWIYYAGISWKEFDFKKGFDELIKKDTSGKHIFRAGVKWKEFDFKKGLDGLIKKNRDGYYIYLAGMNWKQFNYKKGLVFLKGLKGELPNNWYKEAWKKWPKSATEMLDAIHDELKTAKKIEPKRYKL